MDVQNVTRVGKSGERLPMTAAGVVNSINETELTAVLRQYRQEKEAGFVFIGLFSENLKPWFV